MFLRNVLEIVQKLPLQDREECVHILSRRIIEDKRKKLAMEIHKAEVECKSGMAKQTTASEIMKEILSSWPQLQSYQCKKGTRLHS